MKIQSLVHATILAALTSLAATAAHADPEPRDRWRLGLHYGASIPGGDLEPLFEEDQSLMIDVKRRLNSRLRLAGEFGYHSVSGAFPGIPDTYLWSLSINLEVLLTRGRVQPYVVLGPGLYQAEGRSGGRWAGNVGAGVAWNVDRRWVLELGADHHVIFGDGDFQFTVPHAGFVYRF